MKFSIQVSNPKNSGEHDPEDETLDDCVETCFLLHTEMAIVKWLGAFIPLSYKYDISIMLLDIILMLQTLLDKPNGELDISWPSNGFSCRWIMTWRDNTLIIDSQWNSVIGKTERLLNELGVLEMSKSKFIFEWRMLLETVIVGLSQCGYHESQIGELTELKAIHSRIRDVGQLYK